MSDETTLMQSLSKLKTAGKLRYWRGTIEIPEIELHAICDEIQAEYDNAVHALNKAAGNWAKADAELREKGDMAMARATDELRKSLDFMRIWISEDAHLGESAISRELEKAEGLRKLDAIEQAIAATLGSGTLTAEQVKRIHEIIEKHWHDLSADYGMPEATALPEYSYDWQAIADELNAELGSGTCNPVETEVITYYDEYGHVAVKVHVMECDECGGTYEHINGDYERCPRCGKAVRA